MGQELGNGLTNWLWLGISHEVAVKMLLGLQSSEGLTGAGESFKMAHVHGW